MARHLGIVGAIVIVAIAGALAQSSAADERAPDRFRVRLETTKGSVVLQAERALAPRGADRFYTLVRARYFDDKRKSFPPDFERDPNARYVFRV